MKKTYKILDLFCKAGGAGEGYHRAGFEVVGVDIFPQPNYPYTFFQSDEILKKRGKPYIIENVDGAPLISPIALYGSQFKNLYTQRKRLFESNIELRTPDTPMVQKKTPTAGNGFGEDGFIAICGSGGVRGMTSRQIPLYWGFALGGLTG